jgi:Leucine Rich repeat
VLLFAGKAAAAIAAAVVAAAIAAVSTVQVRYLQLSYSARLLQHTCNAQNQADVSALGIVASGLTAYACLRPIHTPNRCDTLNRGAAHVAAVLPSLCLEHLDLGFNQIGAVGVKALMKALLQHNALTR